MLLHLLKRLNLKSGYSVSIIGNEFIIYTAHKAYTGKVI